MPASKRNDLVEAATRVFAREGFHGTSLDRVLEEGGVSRMTLYNHFKSKDELIVAALRRRDEDFRNRMMKAVEGQSDDPRERLLAVFDFHERWFAEPDFSGCMFINACGEFSDPNCAARGVAADHKRELIRYLREQCVAAGFAAPDTLAEQLCLLLEGATVVAHVMGRRGADGSVPRDAARLARRTAITLLDAARSSGEVHSGA